MSEAKELVKKSGETLESIRKASVVVPQADIYENKDEILVLADLAGVSKEDLSINFENNTLTLMGYRKLEAPESSQKTDFEGFTYRRAFIIPPGIASEKIHAELQLGVLRLHLPKSDEMKPRQIRITTG